MVYERVEVAIVPNREVLVKGSRVGPEPWERPETASKLWLTGHSRFAQIWSGSKPLLLVLPVRQVRK